MNYLAHAFLSFNDTQLLIGQFISDDVKGKKYELYPERIKQGILLHRFVDHFTDTFPECLRIRAALREELGLFSPIAIDVFFDHLLSIHWKRYSLIPIETFISDVYTTLTQHQEHMTDGRRFFLRKMIEYDWLVQYKSLDGIALTFDQMSKRIAGGRKLSIATALFEKHWKISEEAFEIFFPKLISASKSKLDTFAP